MTQAQDRKQAELDRIIASYGPTPTHSVIESLQLEITALRELVGLPQGLTGLELQGRRERYQEKLRAKR